MGDNFKTAVAINQVGYFVNGIKTGVLAKAGSGPLFWSLLEGSGAEVASGLTAPGFFDALSGDTVHLADFSSVVKKGVYVLLIADQRSGPFRIDDDILASLSRDALMYFYRTRSGLELDPKSAGVLWARPAGHLSDAQITADEGYDDVLDGFGGWYDAGDFGKYVVNGGISVWTLQNAFERNPHAFRGAPNILDEARWEMNFLLNLQIPAGKPLAGMAFHKLHDKKWSGVPAALPTHMDNRSTAANAGRFVYGPSTAATLNLAATAAQAARLWKDRDPAFANRCVQAAETAWKAARLHPDLFAKNGPVEGGGNYDDSQVSDEFFWAASELFITTNGQEYRDFVLSSPYFTSFPGLESKAPASMSWADTAALGTISLVTARNSLLPDEIDQLRSQLIATAERYLGIIDTQGYRVPMNEAGYIWGSSSVVLNNAVILALAYDFTQRINFLEGVVHSMDYLLGMNSLLKSFVTGYGSNPMSHPHHRLWANDPEKGFPPPPPGVVAGGPNANLQDPEMEAEQLQNVPVAKRYLDKLGSYATNEVAINWNAPLVWVASWLDQHYRGR